jgi:hypothetical protein
MSRAWLPLVAVLAQGSAAASLSLQGEAAWHGSLKPGRGSEVVLQLQAERNGQVTVRLPNHTPRLQLQIDLQAFRAVRVPLGVHPDPSVPLQIEARMDDGMSETAEIPFTAVPASTRFVATTLSMPALEADAGVRLHQATPSRLPHTPEGYAAIDGLLLDGESLAALDEAQMDSLRHYAQRCGTLVLMAIDARSFATLHQYAGCGGAHMHLVDSQAAAADSLRAWPATALPEPARLQDLLPREDDGQWRPLLLFFALYSLTLLLLARGGHARLLGVPLLGAMLAWLAWTHDGAQRQLASWSEIQSGSHNLRYAALLQVRGAGKGTSHTPLPPDLGLLHAQASTGTSELHRALDTTQASILVLPNHLLVQRRFHAQGSLRWSPPLQLALGLQGPVVENRGERPSRPALLGWNGQRSPVPVLQPGERWSPSSEGTPWQTARAEERLLRMRTQDGSAALLLPHRLLPESDTQIEEQGWLLITQG